MYSNSKNSAEERIVFLEDTIQSIYNTMKHIGCNISDKDKMPIEQLVGRELSLFKHNRNSPIGKRVVNKKNTNKKGKIVGISELSGLYSSESVYEVLWDESNSIMDAYAHNLIEEDIIKL